MLIDCDACAARGPACGDCVVTVLLGAPPARRFESEEPGIDLDGREQAAIAVLAGSGLIPPLRLVAAPPDEPTEPTDPYRADRPGSKAAHRGSETVRPSPEEGSDGGRRAAV